MGQTIIGTGIAGSSPNQLYSPLRVIMDSNEDFYVSEWSNHRIQFWHNGASSGIAVAGISGLHFYNNYKDSYRSLL